ncbi:rhodanese-like domain-containing protein [Stutzerimonas stutzeri]|uniref:rhodanese-like domain-containing protein n=1 Tax=Stutzerimonas stutzeri TaxID=316 RepID=UPI00265865E3|nr:rhodanese-like domain-containing protein [Stutzerimonas stutzeri]MCF6783582.1 sulfurtransferase [Stutzerimonas stutzeri]MCF6806412.1 sulfurtransferase [Stutzerimonas stutzeri]
MKIFAGIVLGCLLALNAHAVEIGMPAKEAQARVESGAGDFLFVDVRDPVEIMFVGFTDSVHVNIPFLLVDRTQVNEERGTFSIGRNPDFVAQVAAELERRGLPADSEIITLCRSGSERGEPSARLLRENGFPNARYVVHGFQGDSIKQGEQAGFRLLNGWQNEGLPWSPKMNLQKIYRGQ